MFGCQYLEKRDVLNQEYFKNTYWCLQLAVHFPHMSNKTLELSPDFGHRNDKTWQPENNQCVIISNPHQRNGLFIFWMLGLLLHMSLFINFFCFLFHLDGGFVVLLCHLCLWEHFCCQFACLFYSFCKFSVTYWSFDFHVLVVALDVRHFILMLQTWVHVLQPLSF